MGTIVGSIKKLIPIVIVSWLLTYVISLNMEIGFMHICSDWISNSFLFTIFSGIFASTLVVLICEVYKYFDMKNRIENALYVQFAFLYGQLLIIRNNIGRSLHNPNELLTDKLLQSQTLNSLTALNNIRGLEYCSYRGNSSIERNLNSFMNKGASKLESFLMDCRVLDLAISEDKIKLMQMGVPNPVITSMSEKSHEVLVILNKQIDGYINDIDSMLIEIEKACNDRFKWLEYRNAMSKNILYSKFDGVDKFIEKNKS